MSEIMNKILISINKFKKYVLLKIPLLTYKNIDSFTPSPAGITDTIIEIADENK